MEKKEKDSELYDLLLDQPEDGEEVWTIDDTLYLVEKRKYFADSKVFAYGGETTLFEGGNDHIWCWSRDQAAIEIEAERLRARQNEKFE